MRHVTAAEMRAIDRRAIESGVPAATLMENAGRAVADEIARDNPPGAVVAVTAGYGNNGGDGFVVARLLAAAGYRVRVALAGPPRPFSAEAGYHFRLMGEAGLRAREIARAADAEEFLLAAPVPGVIVDAVFGIGARSPLPEFFRELFRAVNRAGSAGARVYAVDIPSGLDADSGRPLEECVRADCTVTMGLPKAGFRYPGAAPFLGRVVVADIGLSAGLAGPARPRQEG